jgi:glycolate oxidase iron-sulfur subunit
MSQLIPPESLTSPGYKELLQQCIHCGLCLPACPTYAVFGTEMDAPRGRIALMRAASEGRIGLNGTFEEHISLCLSCRACETACPSGVQYGALVETARIALEKTRTPGVFERFVRWLTLRKTLPNIGSLRLLARLMRIYQLIGLQRLVRRMNFLPERLRVLAALLPPLHTSYTDYRRAAPAIGPRRGTVAFFHGCVQEAFLAGINKATIRVLQRNGYEVHFPRGQTCCGAAPLHVGEDALARDLARRNVDAFMKEEYDAIINNAGGCGTSLKEYAHLLKDDAAYASKANEFVAKVRDISEFLADHLNNPPQGEVPVRATYADSCHLRHAQKIVRQPRKLLQAIPGLELVELKRADHCCGSAGVYNIIQVEAANAVLDNKMADIAATGADTIVTTNTGCYLQLLYGVRRAGLNARIVHLVELLDKSYAGR